MLVAMEIFTVIYSETYTVVYSEILMLLCWRKCVGESTLV